MTEAHVGIVARTLATLRDTPLWVLGALTVASAVLFALPAEWSNAIVELRRHTGPWAVGSFVLFGSLTLFRALDLALLDLRDRVARSRADQPFHLTPTPERCFWGQSRQQDGTFVTQFTFDLMLQSRADRLLHLVSCRMKRPKIDLLTAGPGILIQVPGTTMFSSARVSGAGVPARATVPVSIVLIHKGRIGRPGRPLNAVLAITESNGAEVAVAVLMQPYARAV